MLSFKERLKMEYTTLTAEVREAQVLEPNQSQSLYEICQQVGVICAKLT
jgi:hypothetical protein